MKFTSREGTNPPRLFVPGPPSPSPFVVTRSGSTYTAASQSTSSSYSGTLKFAVESAASELTQTGGGSVIFGADTYDLGSDHWEMDEILGVSFEGAGIDVTVVRNSTSELTDTEVFDFVNSKQITIQDMTIFAGGSPRSTSDAIDFDRGDDSVVQRVKITASRGRGIVFDGKEAEGTGTADRNRVSDCIIEGIPGDGIELLASSENTVERCTITNVGGHGIQLNKGSATAGQPNKQSVSNLIEDNVIDQAGQDGININSGDDNTFRSNTITNSSDDTTGRSGIRFSSNNGIACSNNLVDGNTVTDNQVLKTQKYGLDISHANCVGNVVQGNVLAGNLVAPVRDAGTNTVDSDAPSAPTNLQAPSVTFNRVDLSWDASSDDFGVVDYVVRRDGSAIGTALSPATSYSDTSVSANTTYSYDVLARDAAGNVSLASSPLVVSTGAASGSFTVSPADDAYVDASEPTRNYGSSSALRTDASPDRVAYLKFEVTGLSGAGELGSPAHLRRVRFEHGHRRLERCGQLVARVNRHLRDEADCGRDNRFYRSVRLRQLHRSRRDPSNFW